MLHVQTVDEAEQAFSVAAGIPVEHDVLTLDAMADVIADAVRKLEPLFAKLDSAVATTDVRGFSRPRPAFKAADADAYSIVESLFWGEFTGEAEVLLKAQLQRALDATKDNVVELKRAGVV